jgi:hypothetical protein
VDFKHEPDKETMEVSFLKHSYGTSITSTMANRVAYIREIGMEDMTPSGNKVQLEKSPFNERLYHHCPKPSSVHKDMFQVHVVAVSKSVIYVQNVHLYSQKKRTNYKVFTEIHGLGHLAEWLFDCCSVGGG